MFEDKLRYLRQQRSMSQKELGQALGVSTSTIGMYEQGRRQPDNQMLMKICSYFAVTADYLIGNRPSDMDDVMTEVEALGRKTDVLRSTHV